MLRFEDVHILWGICILLADAFFDETEGVPIGAAGAQENCLPVIRFPSNETQEYVYLKNFINKVLTSILGNDNIGKCLTGHSSGQGSANDEAGSVAGSKKGDWH